MAANVAHYTSTTEPQPSIFEIIAQNSLNGVLYPAFEKFSAFLAQLSPGKFQWLVQYHDELFLVLNGILQDHYLRTTGASFAEYFYGLQRASTITNDLNDTQRKLSLIFLVILPYIKVKVDRKVQIYKLENAENILQQDVGSLCKKATIAVHAFLQVLYGSWTFIQYLRYMSNTSCHQTPALQLLKLKLVYSLTPQLAPTFWTALFKGELSLRDFRIGLFQNTVTSILEISAFFMQFLQVWNSEKANFNFDALPMVPPPTPDSRASEFKGRCPICLQSCKISTVLPVSGYVFCFPCIICHLQKDPRCPVTKFPAKALDVIRLYDSV